MSLPPKPLDASSALVAPLQWPARASRTPSEDNAVSAPSFGNPLLALTLGLVAAAVALALELADVHGGLAAVATGLSVTSAALLALLYIRPAKVAAPSPSASAFPLTAPPEGPSREQAGPFLLPTDPTALQQLYRQITSDTITGLANQIHFLSRLDEMVAQTNREPGRQISLTLFSFDWPEHLNAEQQNAYLSHVASQCRPIVRPGDMVCRLEDKLFALLLPNAGPRAAMACADRLRSTLNPAAYAGAPSPLPHKHYFGVATLKAGESPEDLKNRASQAMLMARQSPDEAVLFASNAPPYPLD
ncbi:hypothetical protein GCM10027396_32220 [Insolitispirillum peregrinum]